MERRTKFLMLLAIILFAACTVNNDSPVESNDYPEPPAYDTLEEALAANDLFSAIRENPDSSAMKKKENGELDYLSQYGMLFRQAVNHDQPDGETFQQRVYILFRGFDRPTILVTEGYFWMAFGDGEDLGKNLNANMVHVEHRNFGRSFNQDQGKWEYETSAQVSADLHAVYQALKPILKGKWMSTGTSKNGETSMDYAYYYPNDMDLAAAFCSPFCVSLDDKCFGDYLFNEANTEEIRDLMKKHIRSALENGEEGLYQVCCELFKQRGRTLPSFTEYVYNIFDAFFMVFQSTLPSQHQAGIEEMTQNAEAYAKRIYQTILSNREEAFYTYHVDCAKEQGFTNAGYDYFADLLEGTSFKAEDVWQFLLKEEDQWLVKQYDNSIRLDMRENFFMNSTIPLLFYYSQCDPWSAAQPDKLGPNAKKVINPIGIHSSKINDPAYCPADVKKEVMDFISTYIN
jgi:hypothetical protein